MRKSFSPFGYPSEDWLTQSSALTLAQRIKSYWEQRGKYVAVWTEPIQAGNGLAYIVRSDMLNALPRGHG